MMYHDFDQIVNMQLKKELYYRIWTMMAHHTETFNRTYNQTVVEYALCYNPYIIKDNIDKDTNKIAHYSYVSGFIRGHYNGKILSLQGVKAIDLYNAFNQKPSRYNE